MLDAKLILCEDMALGVVAEEASTDQVDIGAYETALGEEEHVRLRVEVSETAAGAGAILQIEACQDTVDPIDADSPMFAITEAIPMATLKAGYVLMDAGLPVVHGRYIGLWKLVTVANFTAGKINAYLYVR